MGALGVNDSIQQLKTGFEKLGEGFKKVYDSLAVLKPIWEAFFGMVSDVLGTILGLVGTVVAGILGYVGAFAEVVGTIAG